MADSDAQPNPDTIGLRPSRACRNCVQIKARCIPLEGSDLRICQRCYRLRKTCSTAAPVARKKPKDKTRVAQLEKRLDEVSAVLASIQNPSPNETGGLPTPSSLPEKQDLSHTVIFGRALSPNVPSADEQQSEPTSPIPQPGSQAEEALLHDFRDRLNYFFPFVILPQGDIATLRRARPHLYRACVYAAARAHPRWQTQVAESILRKLGEGMLMSGERSLDLLQGLLVFISWYHYYGHINPQLMNLMHLAMSLVVDLGLRCSTTRFQPSTANTIGADAERIIHGKAVARGVQTNEERRAVLACYYIFSNYSACFHGLDFMRYNSHLEQCCTDLAAANECSGDQSLVAVVRIHQIVEKYLHHMQGDVSSRGLPLPMYIKFFEQDLANCLDTIPNSTKVDELFDLHLLSGRVCFYESLIPLQCDNSLDKIETLLTALERVSAYFTAFLAQHTSMSIPYYYWMHMIHALSVLTKLSFLQHPGWDLEHVRSTVNFCELVDKLNDKLWPVQDADSAASGRPAFLKRFRAYRAKLEKCKFWFSEMVSQGTKAKAQAAHEVANEGENEEGGQIEGLLDFNDPILLGMWDNLDQYLNFDFMEGWTDTGMV